MSNNKTKKTDVTYYTLDLIDHNCIPIKMQHISKNLILCCLYTSDAQFLIGPGTIDAGRITVDRTLCTKKPTVDQATSYYKTCLRARTTEQNS